MCRSTVGGIEGNAVRLREVFAENTGVSTTSCGRSRQPAGYPRRHPVDCDGLGAWIAVAPALAVR